MQLLCRLMRTSILIRLLPLLCSSLTDELVRICFLSEEWRKRNNLESYGSLKANEYWELHLISQFGLGMMEGDN